MKSGRERGCDEGLTLIELLITIAVLGIVLAIALPIFGNVTGQVSGQVDQFNSDIYSKYANDPQFVGVAGTNGTDFYLDLNGNGTKDDGEPLAATVPNSTPGGGTGGGGGGQTLTFTGNNAAISGTGTFTDPVNGTVITVTNTATTFSKLPANWHHITVSYNGNVLNTVYKTNGATIDGALTKISNTNVDLALAAGSGYEVTIVYNGGSGGTYTYTFA